MSKFERSWTVANVGITAQVVTIDPLATPDPEGSPELVLEAWQSGNGNLPALIFSDSVSLTEAQNRISNNGPVDALMSVPPGAPAKVKFDPAVKVLTVFFPLGNAAGQDQFVTVRVRAD